MTWRAGYFIAQAIFQAVMWIAAAYFHNKWSIAFVFLAVAASFTVGMRVREWEHIK